MTDAFELPSTLVQALQRRAALTPDQLALRFLAENPEQAVVLSYRELDQRARTIAAALQAEAGFGDRAVLLFPSGPAYVAAFFGCLYAGEFAVPAYPPDSAQRPPSCSRRRTRGRASIRGARWDPCAPYAAAGVRFDGWRARSNHS